MDKMVKLFKKGETKKKRELTDSEKSEFIKGVYELGFEVGYHKHSELGWVTEKYSKFEIFAREYGLEDIARSNYLKGKEEGARSKDRDVHGGLGKKQAKKDEDKTKVSTPTGIPVRKKSEDETEDGFRTHHTTDERNYSPTKQPTMIDLPQVTSLTGSIERPTQIKGFKPLQPKY
ncbi:MAG: hypothetical protein JXA98_07265 [Methanosarcinaceae archaeon]|nr:hypothetical protein [Methanosarcinaceae archaeon]